MSRKKQLFTGEAVTMMVLSPEYSPYDEGKLNILGPRDLQRCIVWYQLWHPKPKNQKLSEMSSRFHQYTC